MNSIVILSGVPYDELQHRPRHFATYFANKGHKVLYLSITDAYRKEVQYLLSNIDHSFNSSFTSRTSEGVYVLKGIPSNIDTYKENFNSKITNKEEKATIIVSFPGWFEFIDSISSYKTLIYDCLDDWESFLNDVEINFTEELISNERKIASVADLVIASARRLYIKMSYLNDNVLYLPNGLWREDYTHLKFSGITPVDLQDIKKPIVFFMGSISEWVDIDLIQVLADERPQYSFVFVGEERCKLPKRHNIHFLGKKLYKDLPNYLQHSRVAIIPFKVNNLTAAVTPLKLYEYLGSSTPVVTTIMPDVMGLNGTQVALTNEDFLEFLDLYIQMDSKNYDIEKVSCLETSNVYDWNNLLEPLHEFINDGKVIGLQTSKDFISESISKYLKFSENDLIRNELLGFYNRLGEYGKSNRLFNFQDCLTGDIQLDFERLALAYLKVGEPNKAIQLFEKYIERNNLMLSPYFLSIITDVNYQKYMEILLLKLSGDTFAALKMADSLLMNNKGDIRLQALLAELYQDIGEYDIAFQIGTEVISNNTNYKIEELFTFTAIEFIVKYLSELKEYELAETIILSLIQIDVFEKRLLDILSNIYVSKHML